MQIPIDIEVLKSVLSIDDQAARDKIDQTDRLRFNENTLVEPKCQKDGFTWECMGQTITVEAPTNLGDGLLGIELFDKRGQPLASLVYDLKAGKFRQRVQDPEPAAPPTNPQADLELTLKIGNRSALDAFLKRHPEGFYAELAKAHLEKIVAEEAAAKNREGQSAKSPKA